jgi:predicted lysophospholipase L1 biosynthesis ABC-type transport system permease subunit
VFTAADRDTLSPPAIVGQRFATTYWPGHDPVGQRVSADSGQTWNTVVGVVADVHQNSLSGELTDVVYLPFASSPSSTLRVLVRTRGPSEWVEARLRAAVKELDDRQPLDDYRTLLDVRDAQLTEPRLTTVLLMSFAGLALLITAAGVNGVVANSVGQRLREIAIRQALGASGRQVMTSLLVPLLVTVGIGLGAGVLIAAPLSRFMAGLLFQVRPTDALTHAAVGLVLAAVATTAAVIPARMALRVDPVRVLRGE